MHLQETVNKGGLCEMDNNVDSMICGECDFYNEFDETCRKYKVKVSFITPACADHTETIEENNNGQH